MKCCIWQCNIIRDTPIYSYLLVDSIQGRCLIYIPVMLQIIMVCTICLTRRTYITINGIDYCLACYDDLMEKAQKMSDTYLD